MGGRQDAVAQQDDDVFQVGIDYVTPIGAMADESSPDSVDEGDLGVPRMSTARILYVTPGPFTTVATGEVQGNAAATQMPTVACKLAKIKASYDNAGRVYLGIAGVTKADGTTDVTTGWQLSAGEETPWLPITNLNVLYRICDNAGDDVTYICLS